MNRLQSIKLVTQASIIVLVVFLLIAVYSSVVVDNYVPVKRLESASAKLSRTKRNPFIVAFQVTRPPGLFQISMRKPVIMGVMSNMTSILGSELARMFSRGFSSQQILVPLNLSNNTSNLSSQI